MIKTLSQSKKYTLLIERVATKWWVELVERETGRAQTLICDTKKLAQEAHEAFKGVPLHKVKAELDRWKVPSQPMYKPNKM